MTSRNVAASSVEADIDAVLNGVKARKGRIKYRETVRTVPPKPTQHDTDMWKTFTTGEASAYLVPVWAVDELRLRLGRSVRYLSYTHPDELKELQANRFKLTMRVEDTSGNLIGNGQPKVDGGPWADQTGRPLGSTGTPPGNPELAELDRDTLVLLNFKMHAPMNRGMRAKQSKATAPRRTRGKTSANRSALSA